MRFLIVFAVSLGIVGLLLLTRPQLQADLRDPVPPLVEVVVVERRDVQHVRSIAGKLQPVRSVSLGFEVTGRVKKRAVEPGQPVRAGQVLLEIDDGDYVDAVAEQRALLEQETRAIERDGVLLQLEEEETALLQREMERLAQLERESLASRSRYDETGQRLLRQQAETARLRHNATMATARLQQRKATLARAERNLERTRLTAPFDAIVNRVALETGDYATPGRQAVDLVQVRELDAYLEIPGELAENLAPAQQVRITAKGQHRRGEIVALAPAPHPDTNTHALRIRVDGAGLYPGQIVQAELPGRRYPQALVVPTQAAMQEDGAGYVFVVRNNRLHRQPVQIIARHDDLQVIAGVEAGAAVVARNVAAYSDGQEVAVARP